MAIYGTALLALCTLLGVALGEALGLVLHVKANVGGVGLAMILLIPSTSWWSSQKRMSAGRLGKDFTGNPVHIS